MSDLRALACCLILSLLTACGPDYVYSEEQKFENAAWSYADSVRFSFTIEDTTAIYNQYLQLEHSIDYPNQNLYTRVHTYYPSGKSRTQRLSLELASSAGIFQGRCSGDLCTLQIPIQRNIYFEQPGTYQLVLEQFMRRNPVEGIASIALQVEDTGEDR